MATVTPFVDYAPVPRVQVSVVTADLPAGTASLTLYKVVDGRTVAVRGAVARQFVTSLSVLDFEAPFSVLTTYSAEGFNSSGASLGRVTLGSTTLAVTDTVVQQPLDPQYNVKVVRLQATASQLHRKAAGELVYPDGFSRPSLVAASPRRALSGVDLRLFVSTGAQASALVATLGTEEIQQLPVWLVRTPPPIRLPRLFYCFVPDLVESDVGPGQGLVVFSASVDEVEPPAPGLVIPALSYADLDAGYATYALRDAAYTSYAAQDSDWSLAGLVP